ncbi:carbamate kinase [Candidatus Micrarchaeota archaeon]|nr:carbamate kinase [Candidatus Micrarchaeota archaeon]
MSTIILALGGNALPAEHWQLRKSLGLVAKVVKRLRKRGNVIVTHGNGPQVGALLLQQEHPRAPKMPLHDLVAMTQGSLGFEIGEALARERLKAITVITRVLVSKTDPAFRKPTKPVGPFYDKPGPGLAEDAGRGYRLVVPSPIPLDVVEAKTVKKLAGAGWVVIACGGGGIPVVRTKAGTEPVEAVIDKDRASALLGGQVGAKELIVITSVPFVYKNFGKDTQTPIHRLRAGEARKLLRAGEFADGSMRPKIEAALLFLKSGGRRVLVCGLGNAFHALEGKGGTLIVR